MPKRFEVTTSSGARYPVLHGSDPLEVWQQRWQQAVLITDENTERLFGERVAKLLSQRATVLRQVVAPGESSKSRRVKADIEDAMLEAGVDRSACVVGLGGGVVLDLAGFVAATYMRGIDHVNVATTLLAQVDAAIGGKTAINTEQGKNLIGAFHQPRAVLLDIDALAHLPDVELRNGLAEAIKHAVLCDAGLFKQLETWAAAQETLRPPDDVIQRCVEIKASVVAEDDRDRGKRYVLNYGHTVAHAIEHATDHAVPHGHAVAIGMVVESRLAMNAGAFPAGDLARLEALLTLVGLPTAPPCPFSDALPHLARDKKTEHARVRCALPSRIGTIKQHDDGQWLRAVDAGELARAWGTT
jgi:3-dehydroquinate synthase